MISLTLNQFRRFLDKRNHWKFSIVKIEEPDDALIVRYYYCDSLKLVIQEFDPKEKESEWRLGQIYDFPVIEMLAIKLSREASASDTSSSLVESNQSPT